MKGRKFMQITRFAAPLGACVDDIDVRSLDDSAVAALQSAFLEHHVLVFPGQTLLPEDQMNFAGRFGRLVRHPYAGMKAWPEVIELRNQGKRRDVNQHWHTDMSYETTPPKLTMLYALETPSLGGDTAFSNQGLAYDDLSAGMKSVLDGLHAEHAAAGLAELYGADAKTAPRATHPVVRIHEDSGRKALYVCRAFTERFVGWTRAESKPLLEFLFDHAIRPEYQARHRWRVGDLVMWDNRILQHFAVHDHADEPRRILRVQVAGGAA